MRIATTLKTVDIFMGNGRVNAKTWEKHQLAERTKLQKNNSKLPLDHIGLMLPKRNHDVAKCEG